MGQDVIGLGQGGGPVQLASPDHAQSRHPLEKGLIPAGEKVEAGRLGLHFSRDGIEDLPSARPAQALGKGDG